MKFPKLFCLAVLVNQFWSPNAYSEQTIVSRYTTVAPKIDAELNETVWEKTKWTKTSDFQEKKEIKIKSVYNDSMIFFLVQFKDSDESRNHRLWVWNKVNEMYTTNKEREDAFVIK